MKENAKENLSDLSSVYKEPEWSKVCEDAYGFDVIKNGVVIDHLNLDKKAYYIVGRQKGSDFVLEHPSLSRYHAVLQYCGIENSNVNIGWYIYDLGSTHGTIVNKNKIECETYVRLRTGHVIKFAGSSRIYVVTGPEEDKEPESKLTWTEQQKLKSEKKKAKLEESNESCNWGITDIESLGLNSTNQNKTDEERYKHEKSYRDDPKKMIKWWFDQEGFFEGPQFQYTKENKVKGSCKLELPLHMETGEPVVVEVSGHEPRKELIVRCAYEACKLLDEMDELYKEEHSTNIIKKDNTYYKEKDYYSSDEDEFFDRTGQLEKKRVKRMKRFGVLEQTEDDEEEEEKIPVKNIDNPLIKLKRLDELNDEILKLEDQLEDARKEYELASKTASELDEIEQYLEAIQSGTLDGKKRMKLRAQIFELQKEENILRKQLKLQVPVTDAMRRSYRDSKKEQTKTDVKKTEPNTKTNFGKIKVPSLKVQKCPRKEILEDVSKDAPEEEEEEEDDDDEIEDNTKELNKIDDTLKERLVDEEITRESSENVEEDCSKSKKQKIDTDALKAVIQKESALDESVPEEVEQEWTKCWVPPANQTGDGRTHLNDELGY